jgi:hypothetical protein
MYCCSGLENHIRFAGDRGLAVLVQKLSGRFIFSLQSRGIAYRDEIKIRPAPMDLVINVASEVAIQYCPWCGRQLQELVALAPSRFSDLANSHERLRAVPI